MKPVTNGLDTAPSGQEGAVTRPLLCLLSAPLLLLELWERAIDEAWDLDDPFLTS